MIFSLIVLLILTIGAVALMKSMNSSAVSAGNLAFHRDLVNQGEQAISTVVTAFKSGVVPAGGITTANDMTANFSAVILAANAQGVPKALLDQAQFAAVGAAPDLVGATPDVTMRYVVDRMCVVGTVQATSTACVQSYGLPNGGTANRNSSISAPSATVYRLTVRVTGPRSTQAFLQTTFTKPD